MSDKIEHVQVSKTTTVIDTYDLGMLEEAIMRTLEQSLEDYRIYDSEPYLETETGEEDEVVVILNVDKAKFDYESFMPKMLKNLEALRKEDSEE